MTENKLSTTFGLSIVTAPTGEALELGEVKEHLRVEIDDDDRLIGRLIKAAEIDLQERTGRPLLATVFAFRLDRFPRGTRPIELPLYPVLASPAIEITYIDTAGDTQTLDAEEYNSSIDREPARILPAYGKVWPTARQEADAVTVQFAAGYSDPAAVPENFKAAMLLLIGEYYENREAGAVSANIDRAVNNLLASSSYDAEFTDFGAV